MPSEEIVLIGFLLTCYYITRTVNVFHIGKPIRVLVDKTGVIFLKNLIRCSACLGFWIGLLLSLVVIDPFGDHLIAACSSGAFTYILSNFEPDG